MRKYIVLVFAVLSILSCAPWGPAVISTGTAGAYYYHNGIPTELYPISLASAYGAAIRTLTGLALKINEIKEGDRRRIITAEDNGSEYRITIDLQEMRDGKYIKATFKTLKHRVVPDLMYSRMLAKEFGKKLSGFP